MSDPLDAAEMAEWLRCFAGSTRTTIAEAEKLYETAATLLAERRARLEAERQLAEADAVICAADAPPIGWWDDQQDRDAVQRASERHAARHASRPSDDRRETP